LKFKKGKLQLTMDRYAQLIEPIVTLDIAAKIYSSMLYGPDKGIHLNWALKDLKFF